MNKKEIKELEKFIIKCKNDFVFFCENVLKIQDKYGNLIPFKLNKAQIRLYEIIEKEKAKGNQIRLHILKARQIGISTFIQAFIYSKISLNENISSLVVAHDSDSVKKLFSKQKIFYQNSPEFIKPMRKFDNKQELYFGNPDTKGIPGLESSVSVSSAEKTQLGRGSTLNIVHLSEFGFWESLGYEPSIRLTALNNSIPLDSKDVYFFIETTANGEGYHKDLWDNKNSPFINVFLSWICEENYQFYCTFKQLGKLDKRLEDTYGDEYSELENIAKEVSFWYPELKDQDFEIAVASRLNWRRVCIKTNCGGDWRTFQQEYPTTPEQAFIAGGSGLFNIQVLNNMLDNVIEPNYFKFDIKQFQEDFITEGIKNKSLQEKESFCLELFEKSDIKRSLEIYEFPIKNNKYVIGADASEGIKGGDFSSITVLDIINYNEVASYNGIIDPNSFAHLIYAMGMIYNIALIGVEDNDKGGGVTNFVLSKNLFYPKIYYRQNLKTTKYYKKEDNYGWKTTPATKAKLVADMYTFLDNEKIKLNSLEGIEQLKKYSRYEDGSMGIKAPGHDDKATSLMIALQMLILELKLNINRHKSINKNKEITVGEIIINNYIKKGVSFSIR